MQPLPIDDVLPALIAQFRQSANLVLEAPPGAGKTTRVPAALLDAHIVKGEVWVLEPRRLATRLAAHRVAEERGARLGETVGYQVRFEEVASPQTRLRFLTEGVLTRKLLHNPQLRNVGIVVLDEFHERHLQADLALALLRRLQRTTRPDLKLVAMSATLDAAPVAAFLQAPVLRSEGKRFDVAIEHAPREDQRPLAEQVVAALQRLLNEKLDGDVLVFLPGAAEIRRAQAACATLATQHDLLVLPLHGELSPTEQDRAVTPAAQRKVILSTNVAESSVTIDGVVAVIDSGLARVAAHSPWSGLPTLQVQRISQASATQRAGRAGRTRPGRCLRLFTAQDFQVRPKHDAPEIQRLDLAEAALELHAAGIADLSDFAWFEAPATPALNAADELLRKLGALDAQGRLTEIGRRMLRFPLHPRQARLLVEAETRGAAADACTIAALLGERDIHASNLFAGGPRAPCRAKHTGPSDVLERLDRFAEAARVNFAPGRLQEMDLEVGTVLAVERVRKQLVRLCAKDNAASRGANDHRHAGMRAYPGPASDTDEALLLALLAGYPDRVAKRRTLKGDNRELLLCAGGAAELSEASVVQQSAFLLALDAEQRNVAAGQRGSTLVRLASEIKPESLIDLFADQLREVTEARWNAQAERVEVFQRLLYDQLVLDESRVQQIHGPEAAHVLAEAALATGLQKFVDPEKVEQFCARADFIAAAFPEANLPNFGEAEIQQALVQLCDGLKSFAELRAAASKGGLVEVLRQQLTNEQQRLLAQHAPDAITLTGRRQVRVNYTRHQTPWIESRLQDFFGMKEGPKIAGGRVALVLHLLAPNQRAVQVTSDLAGFWQRHYPAIRRELSRRYPRHAWPENPLEAAAGKR
ncbi:MAG: ATP-dependent helicase HrpB [Acidobacteria bacterium]|nr:ATP-dependent helicase HrpB [Acidobacteriota bacterium]